MSAQESRPRQRLFIAVSAAPLTKDLEPWMKKLRIGADRKELNVRWTQPENRHITMLFLGEVEPEQIPEISQLLRETAAETAPFNLKIQSIGAYPEEKSGRVLWAGVQNSRAFRKMRDILAEPLRSMGWEIPEHETPHLTLGRLRNPSNVRDLLSPMTRTKIGRLAVNELVLYESMLAGPYPVYRALERFELTGEADGVLSDEELFALGLEQQQMAMASGDS